MSRHSRLTAIIVGLLALAGLGIGLTVGLSGSPGGTHAAYHTATGAENSTAASLPAAQRTRLEQGITASAVTTQASIVAAEVRSQFEQLGKALLPPGSRLLINAATFRPISAQLATVTATVTGPDQGTWQLVLIREAGQWQLLGTRKLS